MKSKGKLFQLFLMVTILSLVIAACSNSGNHANNETSDNAPVNSGTTEAEEINIAMTTFSGYGLILLAEEKGFFDEYNVPVKISFIEDKAQTANAFAAGQIDAWATTVDVNIYFDAEKIGAKQIFAVDFSKGEEGIIATKDIKSIADLKGKTVGAQAGSSTYFFLLNLLKEAGLGIEDITIKEMTAGDAGAAFAAGHLDAAATWEPWLSRAKERNGHILVSTKDKTGLIVDTVAFRKDIIENSPETVTAFTKAYFKAYDYWKEHPDESNKIIADALGIGLDEFESSLERIEYVSLEDNIKYFGTATEAGQIQTVIQNGGQFYKEAGIIDEIPAPENIIDNRFLNEVARQP